MAQETEHSVTDEKQNTLNEICSKKEADVILIL